MTRVIFIRHGRTSWNDAKRIQGHTDIPLNEVGREAVKGLRLPSEYLSWQVHASPLKRAVETAKLLGLGSPRLEPRLMEMHYGAWEGTTWGELETRYGDALAVRTRRGLDFRPDGGESPRELRSRLQSWLVEIGSQGRDSVAVTHKGVVRMALAMATGWDLVSRAPARLRWDRGHLFAVTNSGSGGLEVLALNVVLEPP